MAYTAVTVNSPGSDGDGGSSNNGEPSIPSDYTTKTLEMRFDADFATVVGDQQDEFIDSFKNEVQSLFNDPNVLITSVTVEEGNTQSL